MEQRIDALEQQHNAFERRMKFVEERERAQSFEVRDLTFKFDLGYALLKKLHEDVGESKKDIIKISEKVEYLELTVQEMDKKLDTILGFLKPNKK